jgi:hypothetical protein
MHAQTSSPEWMSFGFETTTRVHDILAAVLEKIQLLSTQKRTFLLCYLPFQPSYVPHQGRTVQGQGTL